MTNTSFTRRTLLSRGKSVSRRASRRALAVSLSVAALAVAALGAGAAAASASARTAPSPPRATIHVVTTLQSQFVNDAGFGGPGDVRAQFFTFPMPDGQSGHIDASTTLVSTGEQLSHVAFVFPDGQIDAQAGVTLPPTHFIAAIIGGTQAYEGVAGQVVNDVIATNPLTIDRTLYLVYPRPGP